MEGWGNLAFLFMALVCLNRIHAFTQRYSLHSISSRKIESSGCYFPTKISLLHININELLIVVAYEYKFIAHCFTYHEKNSFFINNVD